MNTHHSRGRLISLGALGLAFVPFLAISCAQGSSLDDVPDELQAGAAERMRQLATLTPEQRIELLEKRFHERVAAQPMNSIRGVVREVDGKPVAGVQVKIGDITLKTNEQGEYLTRAPLGSYLVTFEHPAYATIQRPANVWIGEGSVVDGYLLPRSKAIHLDADKGAIITEGPLKLEFEPGDLAFEDGEPVHGDVEIHVTVIDPRQTDHLLASPANLEGIDADGNNVLLRSYGMLEVELSKDRRKVQVRPGETVTSTFDVDSGFHVEENQPIPMWHHDTTRGTWVEDRDAQAKVQRAPDGKLVAVTNLPHFSAWNYDGTMGSSCAVITIPFRSDAEALWLRVMSTDANGNPDNLWSITAPCEVRGGPSGRCAINVPTRDVDPQAEVYYRLEARTNLSTTFTPLTVTLLGSSTVRNVLKMSDVKAWLDGRGFSTGTWCGQNKPLGGFLSGNLDLQLDLNPPLQSVRFGYPTTTVFNGILGVTATGVDPGFKKVSDRERNPTFTSNADADARADWSLPRDNCTQNSSAQTDANNNGIGDACEAWCNVPAGPTASWYDIDLDGIDDLCDNNWSVSNPSQYLGP